MMAGQEIKPRPHWWKARTLTTAPTLLSLSKFSSVLGGLGSDISWIQAKQTQETRFLKRAWIMMSTLLFPS